MTDPDPTPAGSPHQVAALVESLEMLRARLGTLRLPLETPGVAAARASLHQTVDQLDDYLLPRLRSERAPLLVVVGGSTGAGKSTLVNSLLGEPVSAPGVLRPTTRAPVLVHHPLDGRWFATDRVLPGLARVVPPAAGGEPVTHDPRALRLVASDALPQGLALLDAPDIDSVESANRDLAAQLLGAADLWLFVTTAARYADAVPWDLLARAAQRRAQVAIVLDRVDPGAEVVADDLRRMTGERGLADSPVFVVAEAADTGAGSLADGLLTEDAVAEVATWLTGLGGDPDARARVIAATRDGVVDDLVRRTVELADAADGQEAADARLRDAVRRHHAEALTQVEAATSDGALLRGEVLARWQDFVGTGEFFRAVEARVGRVRDAVAGFFRGTPKDAPQVEQAIAHGLESVILDAAEQAAERTYASWRGDAAGAALLTGLDLSRVPATLREEVGAQIRGWQDDVLALVREQGESRRGKARAMSFGVNALGVSLMVVVFASTAGLTGAELGIAGGTAIIGQKLLEAVFGDEAVRRLAAQAKERLSARVDTVLRGQAARYTAQLDALGSADAGGSGLREAARRVTAQARAERAARPVGEEGTRRPWSGGMLRGAGRFRAPTTDGVPRDARPAGTGTAEDDPGGVRDTGEASWAVGPHVRPEGLVVVSRGDSRIDLADRTAALGTAIVAAEGRLDTALLDDARAVVARARERGGLSAEHTVVALAGATGSGKSSVLNAVAGADIATVGVRRPTTSHAVAAVWGDGAGPLLDWLEVRRRHEVAEVPGPQAEPGAASEDVPPGSSPRRERRGTLARLRKPRVPAGIDTGLVLLDLPDHDSVVTEHRVRAERLVERADLLVWVVDPQKYADAALHERYLRPLAGRAGVVVVVLNQTDRLAEDETEAMLADLRRLVVADGLDGARVLAVSARTGQGMDRLRDLLADAAARREAATERLAGDARAVARRISQAAGTSRSARDADRASHALVAALEDAAGVPTVVDAVASAHRRDAHLATGWPVTRWVSRLRRDPLRRLGLRRPDRSGASDDVRTRDDGGDPSPDRVDLVRSSLPAARPAVKAATASAVRRYVHDVTADVPTSWTLVVRAKGQDAIDRLPGELDQAVVGTRLGAARRPRWWAAVGAVQWLLIVAAVVGLVWLGAAAVVDYLRLPSLLLPVLTVDLTARGGGVLELPWPTLLAVGGLVLGVLLSLVARVCARWGARRRAAMVRRTLRAAVATVGSRLVRLPVDERAPRPWPGAGPRPPSPPPEPGSGSSPRAPGP